MILDEYLNYLYENDEEEDDEVKDEEKTDREEEDQGEEEDEDDEEDIEEKLTMFRKLGKLIKDPLGTRSYKKAKVFHKAKADALQKTVARKTNAVTKGYKGKSKAARRQALLKLKKSQKTDKQLARQKSQVQRAEKHLMKTKKARNVKVGTAVGLPAAAGAGFYASKRADERGQSL